MSNFSKTMACWFIALAVLTTELHAGPHEGKGKFEHAYGYDHDKGKGHAKHSRGSDNDAAYPPAFAPAQLSYADIRQLAVNYRYTGYRALPPGIQKNLARGKPLPPGIAKQAVPEPLLQQLPAYPGYEWGVYGTDLILISIATGIVQQVLSGIFQ